MPNQIEVVYLHHDLYGAYIWQGNRSVQVFKGNREQVHSWLGQNGYKQQNTVLQGTYRREGLGCAS